MASPVLQYPTASTAWAYQRADQVPDLLQQVELAMREVDFSDKDIFAVRLALDEALVNAIKHGHKYAADKTAVFRINVTRDLVWAEVEDEGLGFCPELVPDPLAEENLERPCGRGLFLMRAYMNFVEYNDRGNRVTLWKLRQDS